MVELLAGLDETSPFADQLHVLTRGTGLRRTELAMVANVSRATVSGWCKKEEVVEWPRQLDNLCAIVRYMLGTGALRPLSIGNWLRSRSVGLGQRRPLDVLSRGEYALVLSVAEDTCGGRAPINRRPEQRSTTEVRPHRS